MPITVTILLKGQPLTRKHRGALQVHKASQEAAALRHSVPDKLKEIYSGELAQLRPKLVALQPKDVGAGDGDGGQENLAEDRDAPLQYSPDPQHLKEKLADAGSKLPILRCGARPTLRITTRRRMAYPCVDVTCI